MKRPYFNEEQRLIISWNILEGDLMMLELRWLQLIKIVFNTITKLKTKHYGTSTD